VGKGEGRRALIHLTTAYTHNKKKKLRIEQIRSNGKEPKIYYWKMDLLENDAYDLEVSLIDRFGREKDGGILTNVARDRRPPGMAGKKHSLETRKRFSENRKGRNHSLQTKQLMSKQRSGCGNFFHGKKGKDHPIFGYVHTDEERHNRSLRKSKTWNVTDPAGNSFVVTNLSKWCSEQGQNFNVVYHNRRGWRCEVICSKSL